MAFKHIRSIISAASTDQTLYTVPSGKEFVLLKTRARYENIQGLDAIVGSGGTTNGTYFNQLNTTVNATGDLSCGSPIYSFVGEHPSTHVSVTLYISKPSSSVTTEK